jgi:hypothetical protein
MEYFEGNFEMLTWPTNKEMPELTNLERAEMVRMQCPHCDHKFSEKGYPRPDFSKLPEDPDERQHGEHCIDDHYRGRDAPRARAWLDDGMGGRDAGHRCFTRLSAFT